MSMTWEEAIELLCYGDWLNVISEHIGKQDTERIAKAMCIVGKSLRPVSLEQVEKVWSPCNFCAGAKYITGGVTAVYPVSETRQQETLAEGDFDFCPVCGRPITAEAVEMVMERWKEALDGEQTRL